MASSLLTTTVFLLLLLTVVPNSAESLCKWYGVAPFCFFGNSCPDGCFKTMEDNKGDGMSCWFSHKKYCCCPKRALDGLINKIVSNDKK
jgi:hypothetical protein